MKSINVTLESMTVNGEDVPLLSADLVVVRRTETDRLDWECIAFTLLVEPFPQEPCFLEMVDVVESRTLSGPALVVRSDHNRHVFRGGGELSGLTTEDGLESET
ncbi:MAG: hypothetical protein F2947_07905 [Actinobacteria bacterium]|jgi:hypothetical protein|uniref:Unannotated protein n=1 Tax=freshwater metagenome TaxID=449393 RepID=A0A6J6IK69_9ZZZZ|nr:hypothetical protein [Actinomycetota bacterium]MSW31664.1 hypothetical protein [Actinomycetota bacterium]MSX34945.1 hypothetical protein [Actinomycetota bacterium]MSY25747.1 hypothetical protein [Actinomycetota bacterium]MSZ52201.1 hypothetical protein [Actinomycetota bacterium]